MERREFIGGLAAASILNRGNVMLSDKLLVLQRCRIACWVKPATKFPASVWVDFTWGCLILKNRTPSNCFTPRLIAHKFFRQLVGLQSGESERRVGKALKGYREKVFVMTKFDGRTKHSALQTAR